MEATAFDKDILKKSFTLFIKEERETLQQSIESQDQTLGYSCNHLNTMKHVCNAQDKRTQKESIGNNTNKDIFVLLRLIVSERGEEGFQSQTTNDSKEKTNQKETKTRKNVNHRGNSKRIE
tara:strand:+ start:430 stop:792 length:363 start_codon:yes stop_codon:yes gene_type:complete